MIAINAEELHFALSYMKNIISDDSHMDIWRYVKVTTSGNKLTVQGMSDSKRGICTVPCINSDNDYKFIVLLSTFYDVISQYKKIEDTIYITTKYSNNEMSSVEVKNNSSHVNLEFIELDSYPDVIFPEDSEHVGVVKPSEFTQLLNLSKFADNQMSVFEKVHLFTQDHLLFVEATDKYCGAKGEKQLTTGLQLDVAVLPDIGYILNKMSKVALEDEVWKVFIPENYNMFFVSGEYWSVGVGILNGTYPDTTNIYKNSNFNHIRLSKESVNNAVGSLAPVIENNKIKIKVSNNNLTFECNKGISEIGDVSKDGDQEDNQAILSLYNFRKVLGSIKSETIIIQLGKRTEPVLIYDNDNNTIYYTLPYHSM